MSEKKYYKYYQIQSCYESVDKETGENMVKLVVSEFKGKGILSSYTLWLKYTPEEFVSKFGKIIDNEAYNKGLTRKILRCEVEMIRKNESVIDDLPPELK